MKWIISPEPVQPESKFLDNIRPALIDDILVDFIINKQVFINKCKVPAEQILWLAEETIDDIEGSVLPTVILKIH